MAAPCSRESHLELQAVEMTAPLTATCSVGACAAGGGAQGARAGRGGRGEILTFRFPDIRARVDRDADTLPPSTPYSVEEEVHDTLSGLSPCRMWCVQHGGGRDFDLPRHSHYSGVIPMVYFNILHSGGGGRRGRTAAPLAVLAAPSRARARTRAVA